MSQSAVKITCLLFTVFVLCLIYGQQGFGDPAKKQPSAKSVQDRKLADEGARLFKQQCQTCHSTGSTGGCLGPVLAGESARRTRAFIESRISSDPSQIDQFQKWYGHAELMPHPRVSPDSARELAAFILSLPAPPGGLQARSHAKRESKTDLASLDVSSKDAILRGRRLVYSKGCLSCHSIGGMGAGLAPAFDGVGGRKSATKILDQIGRAELMIGPDAEYQERGIVMPSSDLSEKEMGDIVAFLSSLK